MHVNGIIIGAGVIGSGLAYELSRRGINDLHLIDPDFEGPLSSSERNAGGVRHLWQHPINVELARHSISFFEKIQKEIGFQRSGYLWLYSKEQTDSAHSLWEHTQRMNLDYELLQVADIKAKHPFIDKTEDLGCALFGKRDGLINSNALKNYYRTEAKSNGVKFHNLTLVTNLSEQNQKAKVRMKKLRSASDSEESLTHPEKESDFQEETWTADFVVICAGAWSRELLTPLVRDPLVKPVRRQVSVFKTDSDAPRNFGMIVDTSRVYFHPEAGNIISGFVIKSEKPGYHFNYDTDFFESHIWPALFERSSSFERLKPITGWGGLYSYTPDITGILGQIPGYTSLYESHGYTGHGLMQSYGAAIAMSELITLKKFTTIDAKGLSRNRFDAEPNAELLLENLHI